MARLRETGALKDAIVYAQKHLLPLHSNPPMKLSADKDKSIDAAEMLVDVAAHDAMLAQVSRAMGLLAMPPGKWAYHVSRSANTGKLVADRCLTVSHQTVGLV